MAICPFAVQQLIPETWTQNRITPTTVIAHRAVSSADSLRDFWNSPGQELESHFYVGKTGVIYQFMDTSVRADANVDANAFAISIESWDGGNTPDSMPWNPAQVAALKRLIAWCCDTHGIARRAATTWNGGGIGGHNWFPYPWADGPRGCPGTERNRQLREDIIPYVASGGGWTDEEDDMPSAEEVANAVWNRPVAVMHGDGTTHTANAVDVLRHSELHHQITWGRINDVAKALAALGHALTTQITALGIELDDDQRELLDAIAKLPDGAPGGGPTPAEMVAALREVFADAGDGSDSIPAQTA